MLSSNAIFRDDVRVLKIVPTTEVKSVVVGVNFSTHNRGKVCGYGC